MKNLYLTNWEYNLALILTHLEKIVLDRGGAVVSTWNVSYNEPYLITNRTLSAAVREQREHVEIMERRNRPGKEEARAKLERLESIPNAPIATSYAKWQYISFTLDGCYYHFSPDDNPFFPFHYAKLPISSAGTISQDYYSDEDKKEWLFDCFFRFDCSDADRIEAANLILNMLQNAKFSQIVQRGRNPARVAKLHILKKA